MVACCGQASKGLREAVLGIQDMCLSRYSLPETQVCPTLCAWQHVPCYVPNVCHTPCLRKEIEGLLQQHALLEMQFAHVQLTTLERIASHRRGGVLRSELSKQLNTDAKNFHYVVTVKSPFHQRCGMQGFASELKSCSACILQRFLPKSRRSTSDCSQHVSAGMAGDL